MTTYLRQLGHRTVIRYLILALVFEGLFSVVAFRHWRNVHSTLDQNLNEKLKELRAIGDNGKELAHTDLHYVTQSLNLLRPRGAESAKETPSGLELFSLPPSTQARIASPFQLIEFAGESSKRVETIQRIAKEKGIDLPEGVLEKFPKHTSETPFPNQLFAQLEFVFQTFTAALQPGLKQISDLQITPPAIGPKPVYAGDLLSVSIELTCLGKMKAVQQMLAILPHHDPETSKPALSLTHVLIKKSSKTNPNEVEAKITVSGFFRVPPRSPDKEIQAL